MEQIITDNMLVEAYDLAWILRNKLQSKARKNKHHVKRLQHAFSRAEKRYKRRRWIHFIQ